MVGSRRQGWAIYVAMTVLFVAGVAIIYTAESHPTAAMHAAGLVGGNMEGKEQRFGIGSSSLFAAVTTVASCGAVNAAMESLTALGGAIPLANIAMGEVVFGGVGSGLYGMLLFVLLAVFLAGLMVGRTPEYLGKKIEAREIKLVVLGTIGVPLLVLVVDRGRRRDGLRQGVDLRRRPAGLHRVAVRVHLPGEQQRLGVRRLHGVPPAEREQRRSLTITFSQLLGGVSMLLGRFLPMLVALAVGGALAGKRVTPPGLGTMRTDTPVFVVLLVGTILLVALLTFVPALLLGPIVQAMTSQLF